MNKDYFKLISSAKSHIEEIKNLQENLPNNDHLYLKLSMEIRYCLSDLQSALDYFAYDLFMVYQYPKLVKKGLESNKLSSMQRNIYFPHSYKESYFNRDIKKSFQGLQQDYPETFNTFKSIQPFNFSDKNDSWLYVLNKLANESKHRNLTKITKYQNGYIKNFEYQGLKMQDVTFRKVGEIINIAGITLTKDIAKTLGASFDGEIHTEVIFKENGNPVIETLENLINNVEKLLIDLDNQSESIK